MMSSQRIFVLAVASMAVACGDPAFVDGAVSDAASAVQGLRASDAAAAFALSAEEVSAIELAKFAQHRVSDAAFVAYAKAQQARHQALLDALSEQAKAQEWTLSTSMSAAGTQQWTALLQKSGDAFEKMYLRLQTPWQRQVITKLAQAQQHGESDRLRDFAAEARARWDDDVQQARELSAQ